MVALLFGYLSDSVYEGQGGAEVGEFVVADQVVAVDDLPMVAFGQHAVEVIEFFSLEGRDTASAGNTGAIGE